MKVPQLKESLKCLGLPTTGNKKDLIDRLQNQKHCMSKMEAPNVMDLFGKLEERISLLENENRKLTNKNTLLEKMLSNAEKMIKIVHFYGSSF